MNAQVQALANNRIRVTGNAPSATLVRIVILQNNASVFDQSANVQSGPNQQDVPDQPLPPETYEVRVYWDNGEHASFFNVTLNGIVGAKIAPLPPQVVPLMP